MTDPKIPQTNEGEGSVTAARDYDRAATKFVEDGKVAPAAEQAKQEVERDPEGAAADEAAARKGHLDDVVTRLETIVGRMRQALGNAIAQHRS